MALLKSLHFAGLLLWCAGLLYLPVMLHLHARVRDQQDFARIRMASRFGYLGIASPAAFVAIGSGIALLFLADALHGWMVLKLVAVSVLVLAHIRYGHHLARLQDRSEALHDWHPRLLGAVAGSAMAAILVLVLAKPQLPAQELPGWALTPGLIGVPPVDPRLPPPSSLHRPPDHRHRA